MSSAAGCYLCCYGEVVHPHQSVEGTENTLVKLQTASTHPQLFYGPAFVNQQILIPVYQNNELFESKKKHDFWDIHHNFFLNVLVCKKVLMYSECILIKYMRFRYVYAS